MGFVEGRDVAIEYRGAEGRPERLAPLAHELVRLQVALIATMPNSPAALAAKAATQTIPIVLNSASRKFEYPVGPARSGR
jgi:putative ABC transport system substrate-binding protein